MNRVVLVLFLSVAFVSAAIRYPLEKSREATLLQMPGKPQLPVHELTFLLPANVDPATVAISVKGDTTFKTDTTLPVGEPFVVNGKEYWAGVDSLVEGKDQLVYGHNAFFPENHVASFTLGKMRAYNLLKVSFCPKAYNPQKQLLRTLNNSVVEITYEERELRGALQPAPEQFSTSVKKVVVNYDQFAGTYAEPTRNAGTYLVITSKSLKSSLSSLDEFLRVKKAKGYDVEVVTEETWGGGEGATAAIRIREWLQQNYESKGVQFVLFIGNPSEGAVPMKYCYPDRGDRHSCYIDFFYADLSGDWDYNKNGKYGEWGFGSSNDNVPGGLDQFAEVHVGRIPYYGNIGETEKLLQKLIRYETEKAANVAWRNNVYLPLNAFEAMDGSQLGRALLSKVFTPAGSNITSLYDRNCSIDAVIQKWNSGNYGIVTWQGHGLDDYTEGVMYSHRSVELSDEYPAHVYQISCHNGKPANPKNLGYAIFKNTGVSTVASAIQVLYSASMKELGTGATARHWAYMYDKGLVLDSLSSGEAMAQAKATLKLTFDSDWLNASEMNLYGCPEIGLYSYGVIPTNTLFKEVIPQKRASSILSNKVLHVQATAGAQLRIYSLSGKVLLEQVMSTAEHSLSVSGFGQGVYLLKVVDGKRVLLQQKIEL